MAELSRRVRLEVESWGDVWVEGELSDFARAKMENGERVRVLGALSLFEPSAMLQSLAAGDEGAERARRMRPRTRGKLRGAGRRALRGPLRFAFTLACCPAGKARTARTSSHPT